MKILLLLLSLMVIHVESTKSETSKSSLTAQDCVFMKSCLIKLNVAVRTQWLYRTNGKQWKVNRLTEELMAGRTIEWDQFDAAAIASALKGYLREKLQEPLTTSRYYQHFLVAAKQTNPEMSVPALHYVVNLLPKENYNMLNMLIGHLQTVAGHREENLMDAKSLGTCFGPSLFKLGDTDTDNIGPCNAVVEILIENYNTIFSDKRENFDTSSLDPPFPKAEEMRDNTSHNGQRHKGYPEFKGGIRTTLRTPPTDGRHHSLHKLRESVESFRDHISGLGNSLEKIFHRLDHSDGD